MGVAATRSGARTAGIVLCGGHSKRMGQPKAWLPFGDEFLLQRVVRIVGEAVGRVVVVAAKDQSIPPLPDFARRVDDRVIGQGPLAGLAAGLAAVEGDCELVFLTACDTPFLTPSFIHRLVDSICDPAIQAIVPFTEHFHPLASVFRVSVRPVVEKRLAEGRLRVHELFDELPTRILKREEFADIDLDLESLRNINTPDDYTSALNDFILWSA